MRLGSRTHSLQSQSRLKEARIPNLMRRLVAGVGKGAVAVPQRRVCPFWIEESLLPSGENREERGEESCLLFESGPQLATNLVSPSMRKCHIP